MGKNNGRRRSVHSERMPGQGACLHSGATAVILQFCITKLSANTQLDFITGPRALICDAGHTGESVPGTFLIGRRRT